MPRTWQRAKFLYNTNIKEKMEEDKMSKLIVLLDVGYSSKKEGKSNAILLKIRKERMERCFTIPR